MKPSSEIDIESTDVDMLTSGERGDRLGAGPSPTPRTERPPFDIAVERSRAEVWTLHPPGHPDLRPPGPDGAVEPALGTGPAPLTDRDPTFDRSPDRRRSLQ